MEAQISRTWMSTFSLAAELKWALTLFASFCSRFSHPMRVRVKSIFYEFAVLKKMHCIQWDCSSTLCFLYFFMIKKFFFFIFFEVACFITIEAPLRELCECHVALLNASQDCAFNVTQKVCLVSIYRFLCEFFLI